MHCTWLNLNKIDGISILQSANKQGNPSFHFHAPGSKRGYPCTQTASAVPKYFPRLLQFCTGYRIWHASLAWKRKTGEKRWFSHSLKCPNTSNPFRYYYTNCYNMTSDLFTVFWPHVHRRTLNVDNGRRRQKMSVPWDLRVDGCFFVVFLFVLLLLFNCMKLTTFSFFLFLYTISKHKKSFFFNRKYNFRFVDQKWKNLYCRSKVHKVCKFNSLLVFVYWWLFFFNTKFATAVQFKPVSAVSKNPRNPLVLGLQPKVGSFLQHVGPHFIPIRFLQGGK